MRAFRPLAPSWPSLRRAAETLLLAGAGGAALGLAGFPAGWLSGAMLSVGIAALAKRPVLIPDPLARVTYILTGASLGGAVTPETLYRMGTWPASLALLALAMVLLTVAVTTYLIHVHRWDRGSALLAAYPGALATSLVLAAENGADVRAVAVVQTVRVFVLALVLPLALAALGLGEPAAPVATPATWSHPGQLLLLVVVSTAAALIAHRVRFPGGLIFGAMIASAVLHGAGLVTVTLPPAVTIAAFVALGGLTGTRFANTDLRLLRSLAGAALGAVLIGAAVAVSFAALATVALSLKLGDAVIAYAPGAIDAMMILALALHLDPVFVGAHHVARFLLVLVTMPLVVRFMQRTREPERPPGKP